MKTAERYAKVLDRFREEMPDPETELRFANPFQLLVAVILSAQCTDKRVNLVTPELFKAFPTPAKLAEAQPEEVYEYIKSISYPNNKTRALIGMGKALVERFNGKVPGNIDDLLSLPGVGRKTANVILSVIFDKAAMAVDTHVFRVSNRIGLTCNSKSVLATEKTLTRHIPDSDMPRAHHWLILHGRYVCQARKPRCGECCLRDLCKTFQAEEKKKARDERRKAAKAVPAETAPSASPLTSQSHEDTNPQP